MFKWIRSLFTHEPDENPATDNFDAMKSEVEQILQLDLSSDDSREEHSEFVVAVLRKLDTEIENISQQANGYPANPISALVWMNGAGYGSLASALTCHFHDAGWLKREENASALWAKVTLAVCSHYHHMVGPAMLANADCHERLGNTDRAAQMYGGVVKDFSFIADDWANESTSPTDDDRLALESLQTAVQRLLANGVNDLDGIDVTAIQQQTAFILSRPHPDQQKESS
ncbi:hypothetical protein [uncultured Rubinisphaera sp.]|uniref:hypothetical protein n=1 Tax=uncultured Rubinisphaera sp. TaxID=1678686 RepID=UPI000EE8EC1A|nr:hypothetical protein [Planctomycetaceae bacterium]